ncbi:ATP-dependent RNA helicase DBP3 [Balamuthia mandrillaris]
MSSTKKGKEEKQVAKDKSKDKKKKEKKDKKKVTEEEEAAASNGGGSDGEQGAGVIDLEAAGVKHSPSLDKKPKKGILRKEGDASPARKGLAVAGLEAVPENEGKSTKKSKYAVVEGKAGVIRKDDEGAGGDSLKSRSRSKTSPASSGGKDKDKDSSNTISKGSKDSSANNIIKKDKEKSNQIIKKK